MIRLKILLIDLRIFANIMRINTKYYFERAKIECLRFCVFMVGG